MAENKKVTWHGAWIQDENDDWFQDVTDGWKVGIIHIGNDIENPISLCRYQNSEYDNVFPLGWRVRIE